MEFNIHMSQYMINEISKLNQFEDIGDNTNYQKLMFAEYIEKLNNIQALSDFKSNLRQKVNKKGINKTHYTKEFSEIISELTPIFDPPEVMIGDQEHPFTKIGITYEMFENSYIQNTTFTDIPKIITNDQMVIGKWENPCIISGVSNKNVNHIRIMLRTMCDDSFDITENDDEIKIILMSKKIIHQFGIVSFTRVMTVFQNNDIIINNIWEVNFTQ